MNVFKHLVVNLIMCTAFKLFHFSFEETAENPQFDKVNLHRIISIKSRKGMLYISLCYVLTGAYGFLKTCVDSNYSAKPR